MLFSATRRRKAIVVGEQDERRTEASGIPVVCFARADGALQMLQRAIDARQRDGTTTVLGDFEATFCLRDCVFRKGGLCAGVFDTQYAKVSDPILRSLS